jgi:hypothetical protein
MRYLSQGRALRHAYHREQVHEHAHVGRGLLVQKKLVSIHQLLVYLSAPSPARVPVDVHQVAGVPDPGRDHV